MKRIGIVSAVLAAAAALSGCSIEYTDDGYWAEDEYVYADDYGAYGDFAVHATDLHGDMGEIQGYSGNIWLESGQGYSGYSEVELQSEVRGEWAVMTRVEVDNGFGSLEPGRVYEFEGYGDGYVGNAPHVRVMGCSGSQRDVWDYDQYADKVSVRVEQGSRPGFIHIDFVARFTHYDEWSASVSTEQQTRGSFEVEVR